jgi:dGTP triphosphohydrolase
VKDVVAASWDCTGEVAVEGEKPWVRMSDEVGRTTTGLRQFMFERFYHAISGSREGRKAAEIVRILLEHFRHNPDGIPAWLRDISGSDEQAAADYVCGMTDNYALTIAERIRPGLSEGVFQGRI